MAGAALQAEAPGADMAAVKQGLSGNLCRCTGYYAIEAAFNDPGPVGDACSVHDADPVGDPDPVGVGS